MNNQDIRAEAREKGVFLYQIAERLGKSEATMTRLMRRELSPEHKKQFRAAMCSIASERTKK